MSTRNGDFGGMSAEDRELFELLLAEEGLDLEEESSSQAPGQAIRPRDDLQERPLSFAQQRLWLLDQLEPGNPAYNMPFVLRLQGDLQIRAWRHSLDEIQRRHEALRTVFAQDDPEQPPHQLVVEMPTTSRPLPLVDLRGLRPKHKDEAARALVRTGVLRPFELARGPLFRYCLLRQDDRDHIFLLNMHHIVSDGWSMGVLVRETVALYQAFLEQRPAPLPPLAIQYTDFAVWQRRWAQEGGLDAQLDYWRDQLTAGDGIDTVLQLPGDFARPARVSPLGASSRLQVEADTLQAAKALADRSGSTLFMVLLAAFGAYLGRLTGRRDIRIGSPIANRNRSEVEGLIGFFVNTLVFRVDLDAEVSAGDATSSSPTFEALLRRVRDVTLAAYDHQDLPFERLVEELRPERRLGHAPLFQVMLVLQNQPSMAVKLPDLELSPVPMPDEATKFDLTIYAVEQSRGLQLQARFRRQLFETTTIQRWLRGFERLLTQAVRRSYTRVDALTWMTRAEMHQTLAEWASSRPPFGGSSIGGLFERGFLGRFEQQAARRGDALALVCGERQWSYQGLDRAAAAVARAVQRISPVGVPPVWTVLLLPRSAWTVLGYLAAWKANSVCVVLDVDQPEARWGQILDVLTSFTTRLPILTWSGLPAETRAALARRSDVEILELDRWAGPLASSVAAPAVWPEWTPTDPAYVLFTSGSTGIPKGVVVSHGALETYTAGILDRLRSLDTSPAQSEPIDATVVSTPAADLGHTAILAALASGGTLQVLTRQQVLDPELAAQALRRRPTDLLKIVPSHLDALLAAYDAGAVLPRRYLVSGGEALSPDLVQRVETLWRRAPVLSPDHKPWLLNHYGPTETTVGALVHPVASTHAPNHVSNHASAHASAHAPPHMPTGVASLDSAMDRSAARVPVGRPLAGYKAYVVGPRGATRPDSVAALVPGELWLGGPAVASGYLGDPRHTAEVFVPDGMSRPAVAGARLYRTGDLVRWWTIGVVEFLGRIDHQLKVRGYRVELGEVEAALRALPAVREAVVVACGQRGDDSLSTPPPASPELVAFVTSDEPTFDTDVVRSQLGARLPAYMVPSAVVQLDVLPLNANGKVDRAALRDSAAGASVPAATLSGQKAHIPPRTETEARVAAIYSEILGLESVDGESPISVEASFFDLGGHSLLATRAVSRLRREFADDLAALDLPLSALFEYPSAAALAAWLDRQGSAEETVDGGPTTRRALPPIEASPRPGALPLSFSQERLWLLHQLQPNGIAYNVPSVLRLRGAFDVQRLHSALSDVARRHEVLRTTFHDSDAPGGAEQRIASPTSGQTISDSPIVDLPVIDLRSLDAARRQSEAHRLAIAEGQRPFDLRRGPVWRIVLLRLEEAELLPSGAVRSASGEAFLLLTLHHIVSDAWSRGILVRELVAFYQGRDLEPLPLQYADYALWQRQHLEGEVLDAQLDYWRRKLADAPKVLELPLDHPRPPVQRSRGDHHWRRLTPQLTAGLRDLAKQEGVTLFMLLLSAFGVLLARHAYPAARRSTLLIGSPIANRHHDEIEPLIGFFVNTLVLRLDVQGDAAFQQLLQQVRDTALEAYAHQDFPFERLVEELEPERDLSRGALFQVMFVLQNAPRATAEVTGVGFESVEAETGIAKFDLTLAAVEMGDEHGLTLSLERDRDLFDATTALRLLAQLEQLLVAVTRVAPSPIHQLTLLTPAERHQLFAWEQQTVREPRHVWRRMPPTSLHGPVVQCAIERPDAVAVVAGRLTLSYREFVRQFQSLAQQLRGLGVTTDDRVAVLAQRSVEQVTAQLAILAAGGAFVPLDPDYPSQRLAMMVQDARPRLVWVQPGLEALAHEFTQGTDSLVVELRMPGSAARTMPDSATPASTAPDPIDFEIASPHQAAYLIYTSGSTGRPKGVLISHAAIVQQLVWSQINLPLGPADALLIKTAASFDVAVWELFAPFWAGARTVLTRPGGQRDSAYLLRMCRRAQISQLHFVPSQLELFLDSAEIDPMGCPTLRRVCTAGEALPIHASRRLAIALPTTRLFNLYGPTETIVVDSFYPLPHRTSGELVTVSRTVPLGRPFHDVRFRVLDTWGRRSPIGVAGHLHIGGDQLARGYLGRPAVTAAVFIPDDHPAAAPGARQYRSGDRVRWLVRGDLEFLGRLDQQVKLRGLRLEPAEIEARLLEFPQVQQAVVLPQRSPAGDDRLVAYLVREEPESGETGVEIDSEELRAFLQRTLPDFMVPTHFVSLERLLLAPGGKLDRRALPEPVWNPISVGPAQPGRALRGPLETLIAGHFAEVLGLSSTEGDAAAALTADQSFFDLGGHSLLAARMLSRVRAATGVELPLQALFEAPTVAQLARRVDEALVGAPTAAVTWAAVPRVEGEALPLAPQQERLWFLDQLEGGSSSSYNLSMALLLQATEPGLEASLDGSTPDVAALHGALNRILSRHEALRARFEPPGLERDAPAMYIQPAVPQPLPVVDLTALGPDRSQSTARRLARAWVARPFDLRRGPLLRAVWFVLPPVSGHPQGALVIAQHHISGDGWSNGILLRELAAFYGDLRHREGGGAASFEALPLQYPDYAILQRRRLDQGLATTQLEWWRRRLTSDVGQLLPVLDLPVDRPRSATPGAAGYVAAQLDASVTQALEQYARQAGATSFMVHLALYALLLGRLSGQQVFAVGVPIAGREVELEPLIGLFANTLVLPIEQPAEGDFSQLVHRVRRTVLDAFAHQDVPFERLVEVLQPQRDLTRSPLFQVMFDLAHATAVQPPSLPGVEVLPMGVEASSAKFELTFSLVLQDGALGGGLEFDASRFDRTTIERWLRSWRVLVRAAVERPTAALASLAWLAAAERHQLLREWSQPLATSVADVRVPDILETLQQQVAARPDAIAIDAETEVGVGSALSYGELLRRIERRAERLRSTGLGLEDVAPVQLARSPELIVELLAMLRLGAAYLPIDPNLPSARREALLHATEQGKGDRGVDDTERLARLTQLPEVPLLPRQRAAYVIYTSGSTGQPKGVVISADSLAVYAHDTARRFHLSPGSRVLQFASVSFDAAGEEIYPTLLAGGCLVLRTDRMLAGAADFLQACRRRAVTVLDLPTAWWHEVVSSLGGDETAAAGSPWPGTLQRVILGGEAVQAARVEEWWRQVGDSIELINTYGPTEATIVATEAALRQPVLGRATSATIGRPVAGAHVRVLDRRLRPVPVGVAGELCLGGTGLARGYLDQPALTATSFVPDPFGLGECGGLRLYRSGDRVRWSSDGRLEFLGRLDRQLKLRGFRVEPGEVEALLVVHSDVGGAAVVESRGSLIAFVTPAHPQVESTRLGVDLQQDLRRRLPSYMTPARIEVLDALPVTATGKIDHGVLVRWVQDRAPVAGGDSSSVVRDAPSTPEETQVAAIWAEVLQLDVDTLARSDDFFHLGGHSLLATRVLARLRRAFAPNRAPLPTGIPSGDEGELDLQLSALFEYPTLSTLARHLGELRRAASVRATATLTRLAPALESVPRQRPLPLSFAQQRLWFLHRLDPDSTAYNMPTSLRLEGDLRPERLAAALAHLVTRHEILRTTYRLSQQGGEPEQVIQAPGVVELPVVDLTGIDRQESSPDAEREAQRLATYAARTTFDLSTGPVLRAHLVRMQGADQGADVGSRVHLVLLTVHHIATDGWSEAILIRDLAAAYQELTTNSTAAVAVESATRERLQYADYALWQRRWLGEGSAELERQLDWWRQRLQGAPELLALPLDRPRRRLDSAEAQRGARRVVYLEPSLVDGLRSLATRYGATLFMVLLASWQLLLARLTGHYDVPVGTPIAGRTRVELEDMIGLFVNTLVLRARPRPEESFGDFLQRSRARVLEVWRHQELPFERLVEEIQPTRSLDHNPVIQVLFALQNLPATDVRLPDLHLSPATAPDAPESFEEHQIKLDLELALAEARSSAAPKSSGAGAVMGTWGYRISLFDATTIERWLQSWRHLLHAIVERKDLPEASRPWTELPWMRAAEIHQLRHEFNDTDVEFNDTDFQPGTSEHLWARLSEHARRYTDAVALVFDRPTSATQHLTWGELDRRCARIARRLRDLGAGPERVIGVYRGSSIEQVLAQLAIWRCGAVYVPLDPTLPLERLRFVITDSDAELILVGPERQALDVIPDLEATVVDLDEASFGHAGFSVSASEPPPDPRTLAYVIHTSGSTGQPKGVAVPHVGMLDLIDSLEHSFVFPERGRHLQFASIGFDASIMELLAALARGATLVLGDRRTLAPGVDLSELLQRQAIDVAMLTPSVLAAQLPASSHLQDKPVPERAEPGLAQVQTILMGGEACPAEIASRVSSRCRLYNCYGPTEITVIVTATALPSGDYAFPPSIGRPLPNSHAHILDRTAQLVPLGVVGELWVGTAGLARGYLGRAARTAEVFVPDPFPQVAGSRLYRTGDLVRRRRDGRLDFAGRVDHQVKIRGFRIEPGEVEAVLGSQPGVREAFVVALQVDEDGQARLAACVVPSNPADPPREDALRTALRERLPEYMVPSTLVVREEVPRTGSDKIDRQALGLVLANVSRDQGGSGAAASTPDELLLAAIWRDLLQVERVGVEDNFFELGGHSLLATRVMARLRRDLDLDVPLTTLFEYPSLGGLAAQLTRLRRDQPASGVTLPPPEPVERRPDASGEVRLPASFAQQRLWFLARLEPELTEYNMPLPLLFHGALRPLALASALRQLVARHEILRTRFRERQGEAQQVIQATTSVPLPFVPLPIVDLGLLPTSEARQLALHLAAREARRPFDLQHEDVLRVVLLRLQTDLHALLLDIHHIASDGWSQGILLRELAALYRTALASETPSQAAETAVLPSLPIQYADFAVWQRQWLQGEVLEAQLEYWRRQLQGAPTLLELPTDRPRPAQRSSAGASRPIYLDASLTAGLRALAAREGATLFMVLLTTFQVLLARLARQPDVLVGTPVAGRGRIETEPLIGFFINTLVLRARFYEDPSLRQALQQARRTALAAYSHQDLPFERLVEALDVPRSLAFTPLFQVFFALQNLPQASDIELPGLRLEALSSGAPQVRVDLELTLSEVQLDGADTVVGGCSFASALFDETTIERWLGQWVQLLRAAVEAPDAAVTQLPWMNPAQLHQLLYEHAESLEPSRPARPGATLVDQLRSHVQRQPDSIALVFQGPEATGPTGSGASASRRPSAFNRPTHHLSWAMLDRLSRRVAGALRRQLDADAGPSIRASDAPVGLWLNRSLELPIAVLGTWYAGRPYISLDPAYPKERLHFMLEDARVPLILSERSLVEPDAGFPTLFLDEVLAGSSDLEEPEPVPVDPHQLAYVIFTSGSTGQPKGVAVPHRGLPDLQRALQHAMGTGPGRRVLQFSSSSFDAFVLDLANSLGSGATLLMAALEWILPGPELVRLLLAQSIDTAMLSPSALTALLLAADTGDGEIPLPGLRSVAVGGEACAPELVRRAGPGRRLYNFYGPTEITVFVTAERLSRPEAKLDATSGEPLTPPIGRPICGAAAHLVDRRGVPVPLGVAGELYARTTGVARGYLRRPALTAAVFVPDPWSEIPGGRMYRTGDLVRRRVDGRIDFLGRVDQQVKLRGYRVELGEIEAQLGACQGVREAIALVWGEGHDARLVGCVVPEDAKNPPEVETLRDRLAHQLPEFMVPSTLLLFDDFARTPSGKIDRASVTGHVRQRLRSRQSRLEHVAPRDELERTLASIWGELLELDRVGIHDHFFDLGGHSLLATRLIASIRDRLSVEVPLKALFEGPTLSELAVTIAQLRGAQVEDDELADLLAGVEEMSEEEVEALLGEEE